MRGRICDEPMLKKIWSDPVLSKVIAAGIIALLSLALGLCVRSNRQAKADTQDREDDHRGIVTPAGMHIKTGEPHTIEEHKSFVDAETGFAFTTQEVDDGTLLWGILPRADGVLSWYQLPNGSYGRGLWRYQEGHRVPFEFAGRRYFFVIADIDYKTKRTTVRVDAVVPDSTAPIH